MRCANCGGVTFSYRPNDRLPVCNAKCLAGYVNGVLDSTFTEEDMMGCFVEGFAPEVAKDTDGFPPKKTLKGGYKATIGELARKGGISKAGNEYDFYSIVLDINETLDGEDGTGEKLDKLYNPDDFGRSQLASALHTANLPYGTDDIDAFDISLDRLVGKEVFVRAWRRAKQTQNENGEWVDKEPHEDKQHIKIVEKIISKGKTASSSGTEEIPF